MKKYANQESKFFTFRKHSGAVPNDVKSGGVGGVGYCCCTGEMLNLQNS